MRTPQICSFILITAAALAGCGGGGEGDGGDDDGTSTDGGGDVDTTPPEGYTRLIGRSWTAPPGGGGPGDIYRCTRLTIPNDTYITNIMSQAPQGSHHAVLSIANSRVGGPDGDYNCQVQDLGTVMLYASGVGTSPLDFPDGVGIKIPAGTQIHLNLHLFNASDAEISGDSAILVKQSSTRPPILAEMAFAGGFGFRIPASTPPPDYYSFSSGCMADRNFTLFALWPHQHKLGIHHKFEVIRGGDSNVLHDAAYAFTEQKYYLMAPEIQVQQDDQIRVTCQWDNTTGQVQTFGDSSDEEMCFTGMYRYPAADSNNLFKCTDTGGIGF
jgi:hypothetical protein